MTEPEHDLLATLYYWTRKTSIGRQEEYNNLWEEIDQRLKHFDELVVIHDKVNSLATPIDPHYKKEYERVREIWAVYSKLKQI